MKLVLSFFGRAFDGVRLASWLAASWFHLVFVLSWAKHSRPISVLTTQRWYWFQSPYLALTHQARRFPKMLKCSWRWPSSHTGREYSDDKQHTTVGMYVRLVIRSQLLLVLCVQVFYAYSCCDCTLLFSSDLENLTCTFALCWIHLWS